jgi:uncharacterized membrane protein YjfL (UPF0719 family)
VEKSSLLSLMAGLLAYCIAIVLGTGPVVYVAYWLDKTLTKKIDEDALLQAGNHSIAIELGATILCQAILVRHAVFGVMAIIRILFVEDLSLGDSLWVIGRSALFIIAILLIALPSVWIAGRIFKRLTRRHLRVEEALRERNNIAMAVFYALILLSMTLILNEGMEDFSRSLIAYGRYGGVVSFK